MRSKRLLAATLAFSFMLQVVCAQTNRFVIETSRYRAEFVGALMMSFKNKLIGNVEMLNSPSPEAGFVWLRMATPKGDDLNRAAADTESVVREGSTTVVTYRQPSPLKVYRLKISVDPTTEDLVLQQWATTSLPAIQRFWWLFPEQAQGRLLSPMWGGICIPSQTPADLQMNYANATWNMGAPVLVYERNDHRGGFALWAQSGDTRKQFNLGIFHVNWFGGGDRRTVSVEEFDWNRPADDEAGVEFRLNAYAGNWSYGVDLLNHRQFAPCDRQTPAWLREIRLVYNIPHLRLPNGNDHVLDIVSVISSANSVFPRTRPLHPSNVLLYHNDWSAGGHDKNVPDYSLSPLPGDSNPSTYRQFAAKAVTNGFKIMPHFSANHVSRFEIAQDASATNVMGDHWAYLTFSNRFVQTWNGQHVLPTGWKVDPPYSPDTLFAVSMGCADYRNLLRDRVLDVASQVMADAVFLDMSSASWIAFDINPNNAPGSATNYFGFQTLVSELKANEKVVGGELPCWQTIRAGQQLTQVFPTGASEAIPVQWTDLYRFMCAISGCLLSDSQVFFGHLAMPSPDAEPANFFRQFIACFFQGSLLNVRWPSVPYSGQNEAAYDHRGKLWANERALYVLNHNVKFFTGQSELWTNDNVLIIETVDGVNTPRTEDWLVKMLACDWYWIYGARAPTAAEFMAATTNKHLADGSLIDLLSVIVSNFTNNPTATNQIEPRGLALTKIYRLFPEYPLVDKLLRWTDTTGEHIVLLPDDPNQPPVELHCWFENPPVWATNGLWLTLAGRTGSTNRIESSTNLLTWLPRVDLILTNGRAQFLEASVTNFSQRFYRAVAQ